VADRIGSERGAAEPDFVITGAIASGRQHSLALGSDGQVWAWAATQKAK